MAEARTKRARVQELERWRAAALWRRAMLERVDAATVLLAEADAGAPISVERVIVRRALATLAQARRECASGVRTSEARAAELEAGSG